MIQDQLVEYISSQMKLGVSQDAIKATLTGAGWAVGDVEDTLKKINSSGSATPAAATKPAKPAVAPASANSFFAGPAKNPEPQAIRVSDLVSASAAFSPSGSGKTSAGQPKTTMAAPKEVATSSTSRTSAQFSPTTAAKEPTKSPVATITLAILVVLFAGLACYFFFENLSITKSAGTVGAQAQGVASQISSLQAQVQALDASNTSMSAETASLSADNQELKTELSFFVVPPGAAATTSDVTLNGFVSGGKPTYAITTAFGTKAYIRNSADAGVRAWLQNLVNTSNTAQIAGTYVPGSAFVTVTAVNGNPVVTPPAIAPTSTASSSATGTAP